MAELELKKIKVLNELTAVADEDLLAVVDDPTGVSETKAITRGNLLGSTIISTDLGMASKTAGAALPIQKNSIIASDVQLTGSTADGFPNTTTTYIWNFDSDSSENQTDVVGGKVLTVVAGELESATDVLGNTKFCKWSDGDTYLQSTDAAFNVENAEDTDDFMVGGWVYIPDTTPAARVALFSNKGAGTLHGYGVDLGTTGLLSGNIGTASGFLYTGETQIPAIGWYHIVYTREVGVGRNLFVNGVLVVTGADGTIGATQSKFQLGGENGANSLPEDGTLYDEVFFRKGVLPTNLDDVVRNIYARSAKKFAVKAQDNSVMLQPPTLASGTYMPTLTNGTNVASSTAYRVAWLRVGNVITVGLRFEIDPTSASTASELAISLPIAGSVAGGGHGSASGSSYAHTGICQVTGSGIMKFYFVPASASSDEWAGTFIYWVE